MRILTVSNHMPLLAELCDALSALFPQASIARETDSLMAGKYAFNNDVDMIFADINMKRMNGAQLIQFVRSEHPGVRTYLIGTKQELRDSPLTVSEDITGIVLYPFTQKSLLDSLGSGARFPDGDSMTETAVVADDGN